MQSVANGLKPMYSDYLIVGSFHRDEFNVTKGKKAYFSYDQRKELLESLRYVDLVIPEQTWEQKRNDILLYQVDTFVMGPDWAGKFDDLLADICDVIVSAGAHPRLALQENQKRSMSMKLDELWVVPFSWTMIRGGNGHGEAQQGAKASVCG
ncbi:MAG: hypothetical protein ACLUA4_00800 [Bifidobacterium sp.]